MSAEFLLTIPTISPKLSQISVNTWVLLMSAEFLLTIPTISPKLSQISSKKFRDTLMYTVSTYSKNIKDLSVREWVEY